MKNDMKYVLITVEAVDVKTIGVDAGMMSDRFKHIGTGQIKYLDNWWATLECDKGIVDFYAWIAKRYGHHIFKGSRYGAHISVVRGEEPVNKAQWGKEAILLFKYTVDTRYDKHHAWLDVQSEELEQFRVDLGLPALPRYSFHLTLGRFNP